MAKKLDGQRVKKGDYGVVEVVAGAWAGRLGYYVTDRRGAQVILVRNRSAKERPLVAWVKLTDLRRASPVRVARWLALNAEFMHGLAERYGLRKDEMEALGLRKLRGGSWGVVRIVEGRFAGELAYYDDDDDGAIIYRDHPASLGPYYQLPYKILREVPAGVERAWQRRKIKLAAAMEAVTRDVLLAQAAAAKRKHLTVVDGGKKPNQAGAQPSEPNN